MNAIRGLLRRLGWGVRRGWRLSQRGSGVALARTLLPILLLAAVALPAGAQYQFRAEVNPDGTLTVSRGAACPSAALIVPETIDGRLVTRLGDWAFYQCFFLTSITIPDSVRSIGEGAFGRCTRLASAHFGGTEPGSESGLTFTYSDELFRVVTSPTTVFYLPGSGQWTATFASRPTAPWVRPNPTILDFGDRFGPSANGFGFISSWATNVPVVVEASADIGAGWTPISTNALTDGWVQFTDPEWKSQPARFYRVRGQ